MTILPCELIVDELFYTFCLAFFAVERLDALS